MKITPEKSLKLNLPADAVYARLPVLRIFIHVFKACSSWRVLTRIWAERTWCQSLPDNKISTESLLKAVPCQLILPSVHLDLLAHIDQSNNENLPPWNSVRTFHTEKYIHQLEHEEGSLMEDWVLSYIFFIDTWSKASHIFGMQTDFLKKVTSPSMNVTVYWSI